MDNSMDTEFLRLYLQEVAFNIISQQLICTKTKNIWESRKRNMILKCLCVAP